ncbi:MAG: sulfite exporter TauE/SafE family protein [Gammaproteobacteria bacterium]|jgi:hypothetical protein|nr:sulfite exporter TauE/SafE family protein [Gammaproteobacteria bacterium]
MLLDLGNPLFWLSAFIAITLTGISKSGFAAGGGALAVPLLALWMPVSQSVFLMLPIFLIMDVKTIQYYRRHANWAILKGLLPAAMVGIVIGGLLLNKLDDQVLRLFLGTLCITFALWQQLAPVLGSIPGGSYLWGSLAGFTSTVIHAGGPPLNMYMIAINLPKLVWLATSGIFFGVINMTKLIPYLSSGQWQLTTFYYSLMLFPIAWFGTWVGKQIQGHISQSQFLTYCRYLLFLSGSLLIYNAF